MNGAYCMGQFKLLAFGVILTIFNRPIVTAQLILRVVCPSMFVFEWRGRIVNKRIVMIFSVRVIRQDRYVGGS